MAANPRSFQELYEIYKNATQSEQPLLTDFRDGSINDINAGGASSLVQEIQRVMLDKFKGTFFQGAEGDDLEFLATDHFGDTFAKPGPTKSIGIVTFSRPTAAAGAVTILAGTVVKTAPDANGATQSFTTVLDVIMGAAALEVDASIIAVNAGPEGDVGPGDISVIESALSDPTITVTNDSGTAGGEPEQSDSEYRETIIRLIQGLKGATKQAILATTLNVPGVVTATPKEFIQTVIEWNPATEMPIGDLFRISRTKLYIADANGSASSALVDNVFAALAAVRACGVFIDVFGATALSLDWNASISLNPSGPNFATLSADPQLIIDSMTEYVQGIAIGGNFNRSLARAAILAIWGPSGSDDLTDFTTNSPTGDVITADVEKLVPGTIGIT